MHLNLPKVLTNNGLQLEKRAVCSAEKKAHTIDIKGRKFIFTPDKEVIKNV